MRPQPGTGSPLTPSLLFSRSALAVCLALLAAFGAGCLSGPDYQKPSTSEVPPRYQDLGESWKVAEPQAGVPRGKWWEIFGDSELNELEEKAAANNQSLKGAEARFKQAREIFHISRSGFFPHIGLSGSARREQVSANRPDNGLPNGRAPIFNTFSAPLDLSYEVDLWGRVRREAESAKASEQASAELVEFVRLSIQAEIASDWISLHSLDAQSSLLRSNVTVFTKSLELTINRRKGGIATDLDVSQAQTILQNTRAQLPALELQRRRLEHAIAVLAGAYPSSFSIPTRAFSGAPLILASGIPSELLERRPDIASAERRMAAANAQIGVAKAAFFPTLKLSGLAGFESVNSSSLFAWPSHFWAVGPSLTLPLFEGGRNKARLRQSKAAYEEITANYRETTLTAFAEVEDNLAAQRLLEEELEAKMAALQSSRKTLEIASNRYQSGLVTYLEVATAQNEELAREQETVRLAAERHVVTIALIKSLGGGWEKREK